MSRCLRIMSLSAVVACLWMPRPAFSQGFRGGDVAGAPGGRVGAVSGSLMDLIQRPGLQKELGITSESVEKIVRLYRQIAEKKGAEFRKVRGDRPTDLNASPEEHERIARELDPIHQRFHEELWQGFRENLTAAQCQRLQEISRQMLGTLALEDHLLSEPLELTKDQWERLATIKQEYVRQSASIGAEMRRPSSIQREAVAKKLELISETSRQSLEVLTEAQRTKFEELKGKPFDRALLVPTPAPSSSSRSPTARTSSRSSQVSAIDPSDFSQVRFLFDIAERAVPSELPALQKYLGVDDEKFQRFLDRRKQIVQGGNAKPSSATSDAGTPGASTKSMRDQEQQLFSETFSELHKQRLRQIFWQRNSIVLLSEEPIWKKLELTVEQQKQLSDITREWSRKAEGLGRYDRDDEKQVAKFKALNDDRKTESLAVLTSEQRQQFDELLGKPFISGRLPGQRDRSDLDYVHSILNWVHRQPPDRVLDFRNDLGLDADKLQFYFERLQQLSQDQLAARQQQVGVGWISSQQFDELPAEKRDELHKIADQFRDRQLTLLKETFTDEQYDRLRQIAWHGWGANAFHHPEIAKAINLTSEQKRSLLTIQEESARKLQELEHASKVRQGINPAQLLTPDEEHRANHRELETASRKKSFEVLTAEQRRKFDELVGKPFDFNPR